jgi:hypothetical protein
MCIYLLSSHLLPSYLLTYLSLGPIFYRLGHQGENPNIISTLDYIINHLHVSTYLPTNLSTYLPLGPILYMIGSQGETQH